ncbi:MAG: twin-arginine translocase TatA/TatE family subunit [Bacteroidia bacterium]|nr:twin-arginine translocase TatA/TatE family subunit [Bacteroidia bacterium]
METHNLFIIAGEIGFTEYLLIGIAILILFGGRKIPELMKGLGQGIKEFKNASRTDNDTVNSKEPSKDVENNPK